MKTAIAESKTISNLPLERDSSTAKKWSSGERTRTDAGMVISLSVETVDAVFEDENVFFIENASVADDAKSSGAPETSIVASLASQLAVLEDQCLNLRSLLEKTRLGERGMMFHSTHHSAPPLAAGESGTSTAAK